MIPEPLYQGGHCPPPNIWQIMVNPIQTMGGEFCPTFTAPPMFFTFWHHWNLFTGKDNELRELLIEISMKSLNEYGCYVYSFFQIFRKLLLFNPPMCIPNSRVNPVFLVTQSSYEALYSAWKNIGGYYIAKEPAFYKSKLYFRNWKTPHWFVPAHLVF